MRLRDLVHDSRGKQRSDLARAVEQRIRLHHVGSDHVHRREGPQQGQRLPGGRPARLRRLNARGAGRVDEVEIEREIDRPGADPLCNARGGAGHSQFEHRVARDHLVAEVDRLADVVRPEERSAHADLDGGFRLDNALLDRSSERRAGGVELAPEVARPSVGVGIEVHERDRAVLSGHGAQGRQGDRVVAADADRKDVSSYQGLDGGLDSVHRRLHVAGHYARVAGVGNPQPFEHVDVAPVRVHGTQHDRHRPDRVRPEARPGAVGSSGVARKADDRRVEDVLAARLRQSHEGRQPAKARAVQRIDRKEPAHLPPSAGRKGAIGNSR